MTTPRTLKLNTLLRGSTESWSATLTNTKDKVIGEIRAFKWPEKKRRPVLVLVLRGKKTLFLYEVAEL